MSHQILGCATHKTAPCGNFDFPRRRDAANLGAAGHRFFVAGVHPASQLLFEEEAF